LSGKDADMTSFWIILGKALPVFLMIGIGGFARKWGILKKEADQSIASLTTNILYPCLIFESIVQSEALKNLSLLTSAPFLGAAMVVLGYGIAWLGAWVFRIKSGKQRGAFVFTTSIYNYIYIPAPLVLAFSGKETLAVMFVFNLGVELLMWTLPALALRSKENEQRRLLNVPMLVIIIGVIGNMLNVDRWIPSFVASTLEGVGMCAFPIGLIFVGCLVGDLFKETDSKLEKTIICASCFLRNGIIPAAMLLIGALLPISIELKRVVLIGVAMPAAIWPIVIVKQNHGDTKTALTVVLGTSLFSLITMPLWLKFAFVFLNRA
jgi:predicted permease